MVCAKVRIQTKSEGELVTFIDGLGLDRDDLTGAVDQIDHAGLTHNELGIFTCYLDGKHRTPKIFSMFL
jgi:hypothetical protein